jgi:alpha-tubulin suppressor-like RCC1 family protein
LWAWGANYFYQLGDGTWNNSYTPKQIGTGYTAIAAGGHYTAALKIDGSLWAWGMQLTGRSGVSTFTNSSVPKQIGTGYMAIAAGGDHTIALKSDGSLLAWGDNDSGQLGDGTATYSPVPKQVGTGYLAIAAGASHTIGLKPDGSFWAWGNNNAGQLGDGTYNTSSLVPKKYGTGYTAIAAGVDCTFAIKPDSSLWAWGRNDVGQLGDGSTTYSSVPKQTGTGYSAIATGFSHTLALKSDGSLWAWGGNDYGQLGDGTATYSPVPKQIGAGYSAIAAGGHHTAALKPDGSLWAWGENSSGQLGDGTTTTSPVPKQIGTGYMAIAAGWSHTVALKPDGSLWAWGGNFDGQLGDGTTITSHVPKQIGAGYSAIAAGGHHTAALKPDGSLWAWGNNFYGQLGDGTTITSHVPKQIGTGYTAIAASNSYRHTVALKADSSLWTWGDNSSGQLGDGTEAKRNPVLVVGDGGIGFLNLATSTPFFGNPAASLSANSLIFTAQDVGSQSTAQTLTLTSSGTGPLSLNNIAAGGDFAVTHNCPASLAAGASCAINVSFTPLLAGARDGLLTLWSDAPDSPQMVSLTGTGNGTVVATLSTSIPPTTTVYTSLSTNNPSTIADTGVITWNGDDCGLFKKTSTGTPAGGCGMKINSSYQYLPYSAYINYGAGTYELCILFYVSSGQYAYPPYSNNNYSCLIVTASSVNGSGGSVSSTYVPPPDGITHFPGQAVGSTSAAQAVTFTNNGTVALGIGSIVASGDFLATHNCPASLEPGANCSINVQFAPAAPGNRSGVLTVSSPNGTVWSNTLLNGTGMAPVLVLSSSALNFAPQMLNTASNSQPIALTNTGNAALNISSIVASGDFAVSHNCGASLAAGANCAMGVTFTPAATGARSGTLSIATNAAGSLHSVTLSGSGAIAPDAPASVTATAGNAQATVTFTAPASDGGAAINGYTVSSIPAGGVDSNAGSTGLSHVITGLANGTAYTFAVTAHNSAGTSAASATSNSVTPTATAPFAYVTHFNAGSVSVIDTSTNISVGEPSIVFPFTRQPDGSLTVGAYAYGIAAHPNGTRVYVTHDIPFGGPNLTRGTLSVIDNTT